jgi:hypothetical protein
MDKPQIGGNMQRLRDTDTVKVFSPTTGVYVPTEWREIRAKIIEVYGGNAASMISRIHRERLKFWHSRGTIARNEYRSFSCWLHAVIEGRGYASR